MVLSRDGVVGLAICGRRPAFMGDDWTLSDDAGALLEGLALDVV